ncbi:hypothetical protein ABZ345_17780 [Lentzea sp. NPDC005914]|uniref:hypothetical protein n=1 Tax=Lentzea sp. NPDC005914 TaxID=3154572 RepID=UPI0033EA2347
MNTPIFEALVHNMKVPWIGQIAVPSSRHSLRRATPALGRRSMISSARLKSVVTAADRPLIVETAYGLTFTGTATTRISP